MKNYNSVAVFIIKIFIFFLFLSEMQYLNEIIKPYVAWQRRAIWICSFIFGFYVLLNKIDDVIRKRLGIEFEDDDP
jgi:hypothetical protein